MNGLPRTPDQRIPPQNIEAEQAALGSAMLSKDALLELRRDLRAKDFYLERNRRVWDCLLSLSDKNEPTDILTLASELSERRWLEAVGGRDYLFTIIDSVPTAANAAYYAGLVREASLRRALISFGGALQAEAHDEQNEAEEVLSRAVGGLLGLKSEGGEDMEHISVVLNRVWDRIAEAHANKGGHLGQDIGLPHLDGMLGGLMGGDLVVLGGRPSKGKSALSFQMALNVSREIGVLFVSLEMSTSYLVTRYLGGATGVETSRLRRGRIGEEEFNSLSDFISSAQERKLWFLQGAGMPVNRLDTLVQRAALRIAAKEERLGLIVIDHLGFVTAPGDNRVTQIGNAVLGIKTLARSLDTPVILCCQLRRPSSGEKDKPPTLECLRESGHIEEHADIVVLIHNPEAGTGRLLTKPAEADLIVAKHRNGPTGAVKMMWESRTQRFLEIETRREAA
jgi:replicative DNA helicase